MKYRTFDINGLEAKKIKGKVMAQLYFKYGNITECLCSNAL
ncbi:Thymidine kinase [Lactococcus lactis subsp. lactis]|nr:Thymidine kinase [Lactococcus lactis subsp. lactis]